MPHDFVVSPDGVCVEADGREIWSLSAAGQLTTNGGQCVTLMGGNVAGGGRVGFESCAHGSENGASIWAVGSDGQLRMRTGGDFCLSVSKVGGRVRSCADSTASDQYLQVVYCCSHVHGVFMLRACVVVGGCGRV